LPDGWHDAQIVSVMAFDRRWAAVRDEAGRETEIFIANIESG